MSDAVTVPGWLTPTLLGLIAVGLVWLIRTVSMLVTDVAVIRVQSTGRDEKLVAVERRQEEASQAAESRSHKVNAKLHEHEARLTVLERTVGP